MRRQCYKGAEHRSNYLDMLIQCLSELRTLYVRDRSVDHISSDRSWVSNTSQGSDCIFPIQAGSQRKAGSLIEAGV